MKTIRRITLATLSLAFSFAMAFTSFSFAIAGKHSTEILAEWYPLANFDKAASISPTANNDINELASLKLSNKADISHAGGASSTPHNYSSSAWQSGDKWWELQLSSVGYDNLTLEFVMRSSGTGPRDFIIQYRIGEGAWENIADTPAASSITVRDNYDKYGPYLLPTALDDKQDISIRFLNSSQVNVNGGTTASAGNNNLTNIIIKGAEIADQHVTLAEWFISLQEANDNHNYYKASENAGKKPQFKAPEGIYAELSTFWVEKVNSQTHLMGPMNTSETGGNALHAGGIRYQGLEQGAFWLIQFSSKGHQELILSWDMRCSDSAPANYQLQYSLDYDPNDPATLAKSTWVNIGAPIFLAADYPIGTPHAHFSYLLPEQLNDQQVAYVRLYVLNNTPISGVANDASRANGVFSVNNVQIKAYPVPVVIPQLSAVEAKPDVGAVEVGTKIVLSVAEKGATIYYRLNQGDEEVYDNVGIVLTEAMFIGDPAQVTITARAEKADYIDSVDREFVYSLLLKDEMLALGPVVASLPSGSVKAGTGLTLSHNEEGVKIYYSINDGEKMLYKNAAIVLPASLFSGSPATVTIKTWAEKEAYLNSEITELVYHLEKEEPAKLPAVNANRQPGKVKAGSSIILMNPTDGGTIYYTINDGLPMEYLGEAIELSQELFIGNPPKVTIKAWVEKEGYNNSEVNQLIYYLADQSLVNQNNSPSTGDLGYWAFWLLIITAIIVAIEYFIIKRQKRTKVNKRAT